MSSGISPNKWVFCFHFRPCLECAWRNLAMARTDCLRWGIGHSNCKSQTATNFSPRIREAVSGLREMKRVTSVNLTCLVDGFQVPRLERFCPSLNLCTFGFHSLLKLLSLQSFPSSPHTTCSHLKKVESKANQICMACLGARRPTWGQSHFHEEPQT